MKLYGLPVLFLVAIHCPGQGNVGIGTNTPNTNALLQVHTGSSLSKGFLVTGEAGASSSVPSLGAGSRLLFFPGKAAFRAGAVLGTQWDNSNVGSYSMATGFNTVAAGEYATAMGYGSSANAIATAMGYNTAANAFYSTAMGRETIANGESSTAIGYKTTTSNIAAFASGYLTKANGYASTAMGIGSTSSGAYSFAAGQGSTASGQASTALGYYATSSSDYSFAWGNQAKATGVVSFAAGDGAYATGLVSVAMGSLTEASGPFSTALGKLVSTNGFKGGFSIGDSDPNNEGVTYHGTPDQFVARFWNGYYLLTSGNNVRSGVMIGHNGNAWVSICDKNAKENFEPVDGNVVLEKIKQIRFTSWNYKHQDPSLYRHYGIMAQDFFNSFGRDKYGTIGNDTTVNPIDMIGIDMAAIQALEKRTAALKTENEQLKLENQALELRLQKLEKLVTRE